MLIFRPWFLILSMLILGTGQLCAAGLKEERAYAAAVSAFQDEMWERAGIQLAQFIKKYPDSTNVPPARLLQAQAEIKQQAYASAIGLLTTNLSAAGSMADQYVYEIGEARFLSGDFSNAAVTLNSLAKNYPDSPLKLVAVVEAASALAKLTEWKQVVSLLEGKNGVFQRAFSLDPDNELVIRGEMLLAQAKLALNDFSGASTALDLVKPQILSPLLESQRLYLLCQIKFAAGDTNAALAASTNLLQNMRLNRDPDQATNLPAIVTMQAEILEKMGRIPEALMVYQENLTNNASAEIEQKAILKIAGLASTLDQFSEATNALGLFLVQFSNSPAADIALLTLGELELKAHVAHPEDTNQLAAAQARFDQFLAAFPDSSLAGKAHLDRGWCLWLAGKFPESAADFKMAIEKLPRSEDLVVAKFKLGDALFAQNDFSGALENYFAVEENLPDFPSMEETLGNRLLYQSLRANLELGDLDSASNVLARIETNYVDSPAQNSALLFGESWAELRSPAGARAQFSKIAAQFPDSTLRPQIALAVVRTYELEKNWQAVITNYAGWLADFPTNALRPQVAYALAQANYQAGDEASALGLFTNFISMYPTNDLAPAAQWWVADHFFRAGDWPNAERNYKIIFQNPDWRNSPLIWQAQMRAGLSALGRLGYQDANSYFTSLAGDTSCPPELRVSASFAYGSTLMLMSPAGTNNPLANFQQATNIFIQLAQANPESEWSARALIEAGNCDLQMNNFDAATNAYAQVFNSSAANASTRSQAQIGFGLALEKKAAFMSGGEQRALLTEALDSYADVLYETNLREDEPPDSFWRKKAGLQAAALAESLTNHAVATNIYLHLEKLFPQSRDTLEKKITAIQADLSAAKN